MTVLVYDEEGMVDFDLDRSIDVSWYSFWDTQGIGDFVLSSVQILSVEDLPGGARFTIAADPAPVFWFSFSATLSDREGGGSTTLTATCRVEISQLPDRLAFLQPPPDSVEVGTPFDTSVAVLGPSGEIDTAFNGIVLPDGVPSRAGLPWDGYPPIDGDWIVHARNGLATFTGLSISESGDIGHENDPPRPSRYHVWSPDVPEQLPSPIMGVGDLGRLYMDNPVSPGRSLMAGHPFALDVSRWTPTGTSCPPSTKGPHSFRTRIPRVPISEERSRYRSRMASMRMRVPPAGRATAASSAL